MRIKQIRKRDGTVVQFEPARIANAIQRALFDAGLADGRRAATITTRVVKALEKKFREPAIPSVEDVQNAVEAALKAWNRKAWATYHEFRKKKAEIREARKQFGIEEKLTYNAMQVLEKRYLLRDENGRIVEMPAQMFRRVARTIAAVEEKYGGDIKKAENEFFGMMSRLEFLPNSPALFNAGTRLGQLAACFVIPVEDSLRSIFKAVADMAAIQQSGGGTGFSFSRLRPRGDTVRSTMGVASGPVSFMRVFDTATDVIKAGGKRRGANMGVLHVSHPDILDFIAAKLKPNVLTNFNLSVAITDDFMKAVRRNIFYNLINPRTGKAVRKVRAREVWNKIIESAWQTGEPGVIFIDEVNRANPTPDAGKIEATNPCNEQPLLPHESCVLGSINLVKMLKRERGRLAVDWDKLATTVRQAVRFLDNVIDANAYPIPEIEIATKANRKIGIGMMGWADALILLGISYNSKRAARLAEQLMKFISDTARQASVGLGGARGSFPNFEKSVWASRYPAMRNAALTTVAPTGSLSIIAGVSSGIEPLFAVSYVRRILEGRRLLEANRIFEQLAKELGFYSTKLMMRIAKRGGVQKMKGVPKNIQKLFVTALDIAPEWHVRMQAAFQKYVDSGISKTVNFPQNAKATDVKKAYELAWKLKCKGITIYRYGSKPEQVLYVGPQELIQAEAEYAGGCPAGTCPVPG